MVFVDKKFYLNVAELMRKQWGKPRLKKKFVYDKVDGFVRIITVECEI